MFAKLVGTFLNVNFSGRVGRRHADPGNILRNIIVIIIPEKNLDPAEIPALCSDGAGGSGRIHRAVQGARRGRALRRASASAAASCHE